MTALMIGHALTDCAKCWADSAALAKKYKQTPGTAYWNLYTSRKYTPCTYEEQTGVAEEVVQLEPVRIDLTDQDFAILAIEDEYWSKPGEKAMAIRNILEVSQARYYLLLNRLIDLPAALACSPVTVNRLRKVRQSAFSRRARWAK